MIRSYKLIKEKVMKKYIVMGNYTAKAFQGFIKDPSQDRAAAATQLSEAVKWYLLISLEELMIFLE